MAAADSLTKAKNLQQAAQPGKRNISIGRALQYLRQKFFVLTHFAIIYYIAGGLQSIGNATTICCNVAA
jgi:hypothetical protein